MLFVFLFLTVLSAFGMIFLLMRHAEESRVSVEGMTGDGIPDKDAVFGQFNYSVNENSAIVLFFKKTWREKLFPRILKLLEIIAHSFRLLVLRMERKLFHFTDYVRGKREMHEKKEESPYWEEVKNVTNKTEQVEQEEPVEKAEQKTSSVEVKKRKKKEEKLIMPL